MPSTLGMSQLPTYSLTKQDSLYDKYRVDTETMRNLLQEKIAGNSPLLDRERELMIGDLRASAEDTRRMIEEKQSQGGFGNAQGVNTYARLNADTNRSIERIDLGIAKEKQAISENAMAQLLGLETTGLNFMSSDRAFESQKNADLFNRFMSVQNYNLNVQELEWKKQQAEDNLWGQIFGSVLGAGAQIGSKFIKP